MSRYYNSMPDGYYMNKKRKEEDKYDGLFSKKQLRDLEGETELKKETISVKKKNEKIREQRIQGFGETMQNPFSFSDY